MFPPPSTCLQRLSDLLAAFFNFLSVSVLTPSNLACRKRDCSCTPNEFLVRNFSSLAPLISHNVSFFPNRLNCFRQTRVVFFPSARPKASNSPGPGNQVDPHTVQWPTFDTPHWYMSGKSRMTLLTQKYHSTAKLVSAVSPSDRSLSELQVGHYTLSPSSMTSGSSKMLSSTSESISFALTKTPPHISHL